MDSNLKMDNSMTTESLSMPLIFRPFKPLAKIVSKVHRDVEAVLERDPAARSTIEVFLVYSGLHALWGYRIAHWFWVRELKFFGRCHSEIR